jgi:hypothetical protein
MRKRLTISDAQYLNAGRPLRPESSRLSLGIVLKLSSAIESSKMTSKMRKILS